MAKVDRIAHETPGVDHTVAIAGMSFVTNMNASNCGSMFITLKPFEERHSPEVAGDAILGQLRARLAREVPEAMVMVFPPPAVSGLGNAGGFKLMVQATGDVDYNALQTAADNLAAKGNQQSGLVGLFNGFRSPAWSPVLDETLQWMAAPTAGSSTGVGGQPREARPPDASGSGGFGQRDRTHLFERD